MEQRTGKNPCEEAAMKVSIWVRGDDLHRSMEFDNYSWLSGGWSHRNKDSLGRVYKLSPNEDSTLGIGNRKRKNEKRIVMEKGLRKYG